MIPVKYQNNLNEVISVVDGFGFDLSAVNLDSEYPPSYTSYQELLETLKKYEKDDFSQSPNESPELQISTINAIVSCVNNEMQVNEEACEFSKSKESDEELENNNQNYCLVISVFPYDTIPNRYASTETSCAQDATSLYANLKRCVNQHDWLIGNMTNSFDTDVLTEIKYLKNNITSAESSFGNITSTLSKTIAFVSNIKTGNNEIGVRGQMRCSQINNSIRRAVGVNCHKFAWHWSIMTILMLIIGPLITIYAVVLWIATAQTSLDMAVEIPSIEYNFAATPIDLSKKRKLPPMVVSHHQYITNNMEAKAKMIRSKNISKGKLDKIVHDAYEYEKEHNAKQVSQLILK